MASDKKYSYFGRDISWLSFNKRVLLESMDSTIPLFERIKFLSIFSSNLEEFYQIRVAGAKDSIERRRKENRDDLQERIDDLRDAIAEVNDQEAIFRKAWEDIMVPDLRAAGIDMYTDYTAFPDRVREYIDSYFKTEVFPFLQPVLISPHLVQTFLRDKRIYLAVHLRRQVDGAVRCYVIKLPFTKVTRFLEVPSAEGRFAYTFVDEVIRYGLEYIFPGYDILGAYSFKTSRDADIEIDDDEGGERLAENIEELIRQRKVGDITRFQYDDEMPEEVLSILQNAFNIKTEDLLKGRRHLQLQDLSKLENPLGPDFEQQYPRSIPHTRWDQSRHRIDHILRQDEAVFVPYTSFSYLLDLLHQAAEDPRVRGIKLTQYRVAEDSDVIDALIKAANIGKEVTVFVELKARFDEENNLNTAHRMTRHGVNIIYSLPGLKVHAKTCVIEFHPHAIEDKSGIAIFSTGNFNEKTARFYSDVSIFTSRKELTDELIQLFAHLEKPKDKIKFDHLLIASHGMVEGIHDLLDYEIKEAREGRSSRIILKMNSLEEQGVIDKLYDASRAGVKIDLLIRGICRVIPNMPYSENIRIIRLVDIYLEHARIWYFHHGGEELYFVSSADWMGRNLYRRIECAAPVFDPMIKDFLEKVLRLCMADNINAVYINENLENVPKRDNSAYPVRTQMEMYNLTRDFVNLPGVPELPIASESPTGEDEKKPRKRKRFWQNLFRSYQKHSK